MTNWNTILNLAQQENYAPPYRVEKTLAQWRQQLTQEQFYVTRCAGTERPSTPQSCSIFTTGHYHCICCDVLLFQADEKFESGTGWPSFTGPADDLTIKYSIDLSLGMQRIEIQCNICDAHLGHVFPDGPPPTGLRYCTNRVALSKKT